MFPVTYNGQTYELPSNGDVDYGADFAAWAQAISSGAGTSLWHNVKDYCALGDGAADDTAAIDEAIDAAIDAGGGTVVFPAGDYRYTGSGISGTASEVTFMGVGKGVSRILYEGSGTAFLWGATGSDTANCKLVLRDLSIIGTADAARGVDLVRLQDYAFINVELRGFTASGAAGLRLRGSNSGKFYNCDFRGNAIGVELSNQSPNLSNLNLFDACQITGNARAVKHDEGESNEFRHCNVSATTTSPAMLFTKATGPVLANNYFEGNATGAGSCDVQLGAGASDFCNGALLLTNKHFETQANHVKIVGGGGNVIIVGGVEATPTQAHVRTETDASQTVILAPSNPGGAATILSEGSSSLDTLHIGPSGNIRSGASGFVKLSAGLQPATAGTPLRVKAVHEDDVDVLAFEDHLENPLFRFTKNFRQSVVISESDTEGAIVFGIEEADTDYEVSFGFEDTAGTPAAGSHAATIKRTTKAVGGFTVKLDTAPGGGNSVKVYATITRGV